MMIVPSNIIAHGIVNCLIPYAASDDLTETIGTDKSKCSYYHKLQERGIISVKEIAE